MTLEDNDKKCVCEGTLTNVADLKEIGVNGPTPREHLCVYDSTQNDPSTIPGCLKYVWGYGAGATD